MSGSNPGEGKKMRFAIALLVAAAAGGVASEAAAQAAQCFAPNGAPYGPVYRMENPSPGWQEWVRRMGGTCRPIAEYERQTLERRPQFYPQEYQSWQSGQPGYRPGAPGYPGYRPGTPSYPGTPGYPGSTQPGYDDERDWRGNSQRASYLVSQWFAQQGRPYGQVVDTGRTEFIYERQWRIFFARFQDGSRARVAVRYSRRDGGTYIAMQSYGGGTWGQPQPIGR
jgi:hypothetical protein